MFKTRTLLALLASLLVLPTAAIGQEDIAATDTLAVASQKSAKQLRRDYWRAERDFYAIYNKLNEDGLYNVRCSREAPTGSVFKVQSCRPKFLDRALKEGKINADAKLETNVEITDMMATFRENLNSLVATNPELKSAAATLNSAYAQLEAKEQSKARN